MMNDTDSPSKVAGRRSSRLTARPVVLAETPDDDMQVVDSEYDYEQTLAESSSRGKKRKSRHDKVSPQAKKLRGKRGLLKQLVEMPLDVLFEIFGHLKPLDLLHLARTTKDLRAVLMKRSSISIWKHARSQFDDLPDCPDDLSEPQYAELLFGKACTFCQRSLASNVVIWAVRVRTCARCQSEKFLQHIFNSKYPFSLLGSIAVNTFVKSKRNVRVRTLYFQELHERWEEEYEALKPTERVDWVAQKVEERKAIHMHARLCEVWIQSLKLAEEMEKAALIDDRKAIVVERVTALGWADELSKMDYPEDFEDNPNIKKICQKEITGRVLLHVDEFINSFMGGQKAERLSRERVTLLLERLPILRKVYNTCVETYPINSIIPCVADVFMDPVVQDLLTRPLSTSFTEKDLKTVGVHFPEIVRRWRCKTEEKLLNMIARSQKVTESLFQMATTIFSCRLCNNDPLTYPQVLIHRCATATSSYISRNAEDQDQSVVRRILECSNWNAGKYITFDVQKVACLSEAIKLCGLDPKSVTREDMDKRDPIFECLACNDLRRGRCTFTWLGLYDHIRRQHVLIKKGWDNLKIELLGDEDAARVRDRNAEALSLKRAQSYYGGLYCAHCKMAGDSVTLAEHVNVVHKIPEATDKDIVPPLDCARFPLEHWLWPPRPVVRLPETLVRDPPP